MEDAHNERYPSYLPFLYRAFLRLRKLYRQTRVRMEEKEAKRKGSLGMVPDGHFEGPGTGTICNPESAVNKCVKWLDEDMERPEIRTVAQCIHALRKELQRRKLCFTTTAGTFISRMFFPDKERLKLWENVWIIQHSHVQPGEKVLDIGGASTLFSFYLASIGCSVTVVDNDWNNCGTLYNANYVAKKMNWRLKAYDRSVAKPLPFPDNYFDRVFSICVLEHLPSAVRRVMMKEVARVLKPGGVVGLTIDYDRGRPVLLTDKGLRFGYRDKLMTDVVSPSNLSIYGNTDWVDPEPDTNFLGALFLRKKENARA